MRGNNFLMQVMIDETLVTGLLTVPIRQGWESVEGASCCSRLVAARVGPAEAALVPAGEATALAGSHALVPGLAVVCDAAGAVAMRTPVRSDEIEETVVRLYEVSRTAELLLRATLRPFFGITASGFVDDDVEGAAAQVVLVEGAEALRSPEAGFQEDLCRAWFILTGLRFVSHVLVVPVGAADAEVDGLVEDLRRAVETGVERRREVRSSLAGKAGHELDRERLAEVTNRLRFAMEPVDVGSLEMLLARGGWGTTVPRTLPPLRSPVAGLSDG